MGFNVREQVEGTSWNFNWTRKDFKPQRISVIESICGGHQESPFELDGFSV